jgi:hypothetical protein
MNKGKRSRKSKGAPIATIAFYGPNDQRASKVAVAVLTENADKVLALRRWVSGKIDVRNNEKVQNEIKAFLKEHGVRRVVVTDRIIGCPHEEGLDYPKGEKCPFCPFWTNRNRWTGEIEE